MEVLEIISTATEAGVFYYLVLRLHPKIVPMNIPTIFVHLGSACNLQCPHCANRQFVGNVDEHWQMELLENSLKVLRFDFGALNIALTGGEPTFHPDFEHILRYAAGIGLRVDLFTNAIWPDGFSVSYLQKSGLSRLVVSLDALDELPAHGRILKTSSQPIDVIIEAAALMDVVVITTVSKANISTLPSIINFCRSVGVNHIIAPIDTPNDLDHLSLSDLTKDEADVLHRAVLDWGSNWGNQFRSNLFLSIINRKRYLGVRCDWGREMVALFPNGMIYPCLFLHMEHPGWSLLETSPDELKREICAWNEYAMQRKCMRTICYGCLSKESSL